MASIKISRYVILREIGRGGMASVYLARSLQDNQVYALKVLPRQFTHDPMFRDRFARESKTVSQLHHPAIIPVYDFGEEDETPFIVMRYMPGGTLADRLARGRIGRAEAARLLAPIAAALDYAHQRGIVHRDIKPANIFFDEQNHTYLGDFGVVKLAEATRSFSGTSVIGTPAYMSPEQVKGGGKIDGRSDIYALAIVLYEMLTGRAPYQADTPTQQMMMHVLEPVPRIRLQDPQIEPALEQILMKALAKEPGQRYSTASEFIQAVATLTPPPQQTVYGQATQRYADETRVAAAPAPPPAPPASRRPLWIFGGVAAAFVCALLAAGIAAAGYFGLPAVAQASSTPAEVAALLASSPTPAAAGLSAVTPTLIAQELEILPTVTPLPDITDTPTTAPSPTPQPTRPPAHPPMAQPDTTTTAEDTRVDINVLANDSDPDNDLDPNSLRVTHGAPHGRVRGGGGVLNYNPEKDFYGQDSFTYQVCDRAGQCAQAQVTVEVTPVNDNPDADDDSYSGAGGQALSVPAPGVMQNDRDADNNPLTVRLQNGPAAGSVSLNPDGSFTYTPNGGACSNDSFTYLLDDGQGGSDQATVSLQFGCAGASANAMSLRVEDGSPPSGSTLNPSSEIQVSWRYTNNTYTGAFIFWKIELKLYPNADCSGEPRPWGDLGYWARMRANAQNAHESAPVQVQPSFQVFAPGGGNIGYVAVHISAYGGQGDPPSSLGELLAEDEGLCYPYK